jgi:hypothetical protein
MSYYDFFEHIMILATPRLSPLHPPNKKNVLFINVVICQNYNLRNSTFYSDMYNKVNFNINYKVWINMIKHTNVEVSKKKYTDSSKIVNFLFVFHKTIIN